MQGYQCVLSWLAVSGWFFHSISQPGSLFISSSILLFFSTLLFLSSLLSLISFPLHPLLSFPPLPSPLYQSSLSIPSLNPSLSPLFPSLISFFPLCTLFLFPLSMSLSLLHWLICSIAHFAVYCSLKGPGNPGIQCHSYIQCIAACILSILLFIAALLSIAKLWGGECGWHFIYCHENAPCSNIGPFLLVPIGHNSSQISAIGHHGNLLMLMIEQQGSCNVLDKMQKDLFPGYSRVISGLS